MYAHGIEETRRRNVRGGREEEGRRDKVVEVETLKAGPKSHAQIIEKYRWIRQCLD